MDIKRSAPGKVILCGEHSVVYGYPAIAVPVSGIRTSVHITAQKERKGLLIVADDINQHFYLSDVQADHPLAMAVHMVLEEMGRDEPDALLKIESQLPIAAGLGSGAAVTVSLIRALSAFLGDEFDNDTISRMTFEVEKIYHGLPSGIDNTVITWESPIYFIKGKPPVFCSIGKPMTLLIASSGIPSSTRKAVNEVRSRKSSNPKHYEEIFKQIGNLTESAKTAITEGDILTLGALLKDNHKLLVDLGVSIPLLDTMVNASLQAGAFGAKLTGSGQGGNMIALVDENHIDSVNNALINVGSTHVWKTHIEVLNNTPT